MIDGNATGKSIRGKITSIPKVDTTLSKEGQCAEAKATGEALGKKINYTDIVDNLGTSNARKVLSAKQGATLKGLINAEAQNRKNAIVDNLTTADASKVLSANQGVKLKGLIDKETQDRQKAIADNLTTEDAAKVLSAKQGATLKGLIDAETQNRKNAIVDNLTTADASKVLSANQGVKLKGLIDKETQDRKKAIEEMQEQQASSFVYVGDGQSYYTSEDGGRKIETGFGCQAIMVIGYKKTAIITKDGGTVFSGGNYAGVAESVVDAGASFKDGVLTISPVPESNGNSVSYSCNDYMNKDGDTYTCIPL